MNAYKNIALRAANRAGDFVAKAFADRDRIIAQSKGLNDFVCVHINTINFGKSNFETNNLGRLKPFPNWRGS